MGHKLQKELIIPQRDFKSFGVGARDIYSDNLATNSGMRLFLCPAAGEGGSQETPLVNGS